jgi:3,4-dihydroxy 2-butanone 4-phosphate synthase/GTP cyclohydrolase II
MVPTDPGSMGTAFTVSIEAKRGVTTGISAADRAETIRVAIDPRNGPEAIVSPGHVFPLRARPGGVLVRSGHTEGSLDLSRLAGCTPAAVICEIMRDDGEMARMDDLEAFADRHQLPIVTIADLIEWRLQSELLVEEVASQTFSSQLLGIDASHGFSLRSFRSTTEPATRFVALCKGKLDGNAPVLLRAQRSYMLGDVFGLVRPDGSDTGSLLRRAIAKIDAAGCGAILYVLTDEVDGGVLGLDSDPIGGLRPRETGFREFGLGAQVLKKLGVSQIRVLTDNPRKIVGLEGFGIEVVGSEPLGGK